MLKVVENNSQSRRDSLIIWHKENANILDLKERLTEGLVYGYMIISIYVINMGIFNVFGGIFTSIKFVWDQNGSIFYPERSEKD